jgi:hypothetical protein
MAVTSWDTPIGFALDNFVNVSRAPLSVESVKLIDAHNVILRGAFVYEMAHSLHQLTQAGALAELRASVPPAAWSRVQAVPGALIRAGHPVANFLRTYSVNFWQIVPVVSARTPAGGWALGEVVTYRANGHTYTVTAYTGYVIAPNANACEPLINAVWAAFKRP